MNKKVGAVLKKTYRKMTSYISTNRLFLTYVLFALIETVIIRNSTIRNVWDYKPFICDLALIVIIGAFGYLMKPKKRFRYFFVCMCIVTLMCMINSIYYVKVVKNKESL